MSNRYPPPRVRESIKPAASEEWLGKLLRVKEPDDVETLEICVEAAPGGSYSWEIIGSGPAV